MSRKDFKYRITEIQAMKQDSEKFHTLFVVLITVRVHENQWLVYAFVEVSKIS